MADIGPKFHTPIPKQKREADMQRVNGPVINVTLTAEEWERYMNLKPPKKVRSEYTIRD